MVALVRKGIVLREVARRFRVSLRTVQRWVLRAQGQELAAVCWAERSRAPQRVGNKIKPALEREICAIRGELATEGALGFVGAQAIRDTLLGRHAANQVPALRTIGRVLARNGLLDRHVRVRRTAPPPGWYLPAVAAGEAPLDVFDVIEDLRMEGFGLFQVFTARSLWGSGAEAWPAQVASTTFVLDALLAHWRRAGLPRFAQFDNDVRFQGGHNHPDVLGRVIRLCLSLEITPVFAPPLESGFQAVIENFNGLWQRKVWQRTHHETLAALTAASKRFTAAYRKHLSSREEVSPLRRSFPSTWRLDWQQPPRGCVVYLRRTSEHGTLKLLGHLWSVDPLWGQRLVRCEVDLDHHLIRFYRLRRREPAQQPLLNTLPYQFPARIFDTRQRHKHPVTPIS